jgi:hypothetical protein
MPTETQPTPGNGPSGGSGPNWSDIDAILHYIYGINFGKDGDYTGNAGYYGDNIGPAGSKLPEKDVPHSTNHLEALMAPPDMAQHAPHRPLFDFAGREIDVYSGLPASIENPDPFTGAPSRDPFADSGPPARWWSAPVTALRQKSLLSSPNLLAENDVRHCVQNRTSCKPPMMSDANQSSELNEIQAELDRSYFAIQDVKEGRGRIVMPGQVDIDKIAAKAVEMANSDEYRLGFAVNQLRDHPIEIRHSAVLTGLGHMATGAFVATASGVASYGSGGVLLPLGGAMGMAAGCTQFLSGFTLAISGADSTETVRMSGQLDYIFDLTASPAQLVFGTTGLVISGGDVGVSHRFALVGGVVEGGMAFRGDPSKLYSAVIPGLRTKSERAASALLMKDVTALGFTARAENINEVAAKLNRNFTVEDLQAIEAFRTQMVTGRLDLAGVAGHKAAGAAGAGGGVDFVKYGGAFHQELKLHGPNTGIVGFYLDKASTQSLNYNIKYQLETRALGEQLVPLRSTKHIWISPTEAVRYIGR